METKAKKSTTSKKTMSTLSVVDMTGKSLEPMNLPEEIFGLSPSDKLLALYVRVYLNNQQHNAAQTKTRSEVKGSTRKIYKQKGTGRARHGAIKAPIFVGGGIAHGPKGVVKKLHINKKQRTKALYVALSGAVRDGKMTTVLDAQGISGITKDFNVMLSNLKINSNALVIYSGSKEPKVKQAASNLDSVVLCQTETLNAYDVIRARTILFTKSAVQQLISQRIKK